MREAGCIVLMQGNHGGLNRCVAETANEALRLNLDRKCESWYGRVLTCLTDLSGGWKEDCCVAVPCRRND